MPENIRLSAADGTANFGGNVTIPDPDLDTPEVLEAVNRKWADRARVEYGPNPPTGTDLYVGRLWYDTNPGEEQLKLWNGTEWISADRDIFPIGDAANGLTLYVNGTIGSDVFVTGDFDDQVTPVISNQMITAGYTEQLPFKTITRAAIEVARITSGGTGFDPSFYDRIVVKVAPGDQIVENEPSNVAVTPWTDGYVPDAAELQKFAHPDGGVILPRGMSVQGVDLRKSVIRPNYVPAFDRNITTGRTAIFRVTGGSFFFNFTFKDKLNYSQTHHLVDCFAFTGLNALDGFYAKVQTACGVTGLDPANPGETQITAPQPAAPSESVDGVLGSSPYIFNCSVRSEYGICGINADGAITTGFKSMVVAQFTGVSLQRDLRCWQKYNQASTNWESFAATDSYEDLIDVGPNNVRMSPERINFHIRTQNEAIIQEVSVFAIGQGIHHWAQTGSEITVTNSNSNFGGCAAIADGYKEKAFENDVGWEVNFLRVGTDLTDYLGLNNRKFLFLGTVESVSDDGLTLTLQDGLAPGIVNPNQPRFLEKDGYSLKENDYLWVQNFRGQDYRAKLSAAPWNPNADDQLVVKETFEDQSGNAPGDVITLEGTILQSAVNDGVIVGGNGYADGGNGVFNNVVLTGGGNPTIPATANITVIAGAVAGITIFNGGAGYGTASVTLSADSADLGSNGQGAGFTLTVIPQNVNTGAFPPLPGSRVYVRRIPDVRQSVERQYSILGYTTSNPRTPLRDYVLQTTPGATNGIVGTIPDNFLSTVALSSRVNDPVDGSDILVEFRPNGGPTAWIAGEFYRTGETVRYQNKHFNCIVENRDATFDPLKWVESYVHMPEEFNQEGYYKNAKPVIVFDSDTDGDENSITLGYNFTDTTANNYVWRDVVDIRDQLRTATDYRGLHNFLVALGFSSNDAHTIMLPLPRDDRDRSPRNSLDGIGNPNGAANAWANWGIEFRRPTNIRLFGHAYEWAGFLNYSKAIPKYQKELSAANQFTYYFTNVEGGRVYASGFNEEGFVVTPKGLVDLATGDEVNVDQLGFDPPIDEIGFPSFFESLTVNNLTVGSNLLFQGTTIAGATTWDIGQAPYTATTTKLGPFGNAPGDNGPLPALPKASTVQEGIVRLATVDETNNSATPDFPRDDIAVTPQGLDSTRSTLDNALVPVGGIVMWSGSIADLGNIPNWQICDGTNGTPDLRNRFIVGASTDGTDTTYPDLSVDATGGNANAVVVQHNHGGSIGNTDHTHNYAIRAEQDGDGPGGGGASSALTGNTFVTQNPNAWNPTVTINNVAGNNVAAGVTISPDGVNQNLPPYFALAYIMRIV